MGLVNLKPKKNCCYTSASKSPKYEAGELRTFGSSGVNEAYCSAFVAIDLNHINFAFPTGDGSFGGCPKEFLPYYLRNDKHEKECIWCGEEHLGNCNTLLPNFIWWEEQEVKESIKSELTKALAEDYDDWGAGNGSKRK